MLYQDKYFDQDKNSILRAAQGFVEPQLLNYWVEKALACYNQHENPMGLVDDFILQLESESKYNTEFLEEFYEMLTAIYRFKKGDNQLEIIWDGRSHYEVYAERWTTEFEAWMEIFCNMPEVYRAVIKMCVLKYNTNSKFLYYGIRKIILSHFEVQIGRNKMLKTA
jgi:hypothetical protein